MRSDLTAIHPGMPVSDIRHGVSGITVYQVLTAISKVAQAVVTSAEQ